MCLVGEWGELGRSELVSVAVWLEDGCLVGGWEGWVGSRVEYSSQMRVGLVRQNLADGAAPAGLAPTKH